MENHSMLTQLLAQCADACYNCAMECLSEKDVAMLTACIKLDLDCAQICQTTAAFIARNSDHASHLRNECAEICLKCADECSKHAHMEHCKTCAEICTRCAHACLDA